MIKSSNEKGFSLIEACIALTVIGLLVGPVIAEYNDHIQKIERNITAANNFAVKSAIEAYYTRYGEYPCPASLHKKMGDEGYGQAPLTAPADSCIPAGLVPGECLDGVCLTRDTSVASGSGMIVHGGVPFAALQMNEDRTYDGYGNRISYVLSADLGRRPSGVLFSTANAAIPFQEIKVAITPGTTTRTEVTEASPDRAHYLIMSHGNNGLGAFNKEGVSRDASIDPATGRMDALCSRNLTNIDSANCDNDLSTPYTLTGMRATNRNNDRYIDDRIVAVTGLSVPPWKPTTTEKEVVSELKIGIGTRDVGIRLNPDGTDFMDADGNQEEYTSRIGLDVAGDIRADRLKTQQICAVDGTNCFSSEVLAGAGSIDCTRNQAGMTGISNSSAECSTTLRVNIPAVTCSSGAVTGMNGGVITCSP